MTRGAPVRLTPPARHNSYSQRPCPPLFTWLLTSASCIMLYALRSDALHVSPLPAHPIAGPDQLRAQHPSHRRAVRSRRFESVPRARAAPSTLPPALSPPPPSPVPAGMAWRGSCRHPRGERRLRSTRQTSGCARPRSASRLRPPSTQRLSEMLEDGRKDGREEGRKEGRKEGK